MALLPCPECSREISDLAEICAQCGHPVARSRAFQAAPESTAPDLGPSIDLMSCTREQWKAWADSEFLRTRLEATEWNIKRTAEELRMQRSNLYKKLEKHDLR